MSKLKVIAITKPPKYFYRIGESFAYSAWYNSEKVKDVKVEMGDLIEMTFEKVDKDNVITSLKVVGKAPTQAATAPATRQNEEEDRPMTTQTNGNGNGTNWDKVNEGIRKQAVGKMVAETIKAMDLKDHGVADVNAVVKELFKTFDELTKIGNE